MNQTTEAPTLIAHSSEVATVRNSTRVSLHEGEPKTLVEVFEHVARVHPRLSLESASMAIDDAAD